MNRPRRPRSASNVVIFTRPRPARASAAGQWRRRSRLPSLKPVWLMVLIATLGLGYDEWRPHLPFLDPASTSALPPSEPGERATGGFSLCGSGPRINCVVDGDTLYLGGAPALAWDARTRRALWRARIEGDAHPSMFAGGALDDAHARVFTGDSQRFVYVLAADSGALRDRIRLDHYPRFELLRPLKALYGSYGARRLEVHRGALFVGTVDGSLFVFRPR